MNAIPENVSVQRVAKRVLAEIADWISCESCERSIASTATMLLARHGVTETWYHDCPALVLLGSRSCLSISGRDYEPSDELVGQTNLVTIDLSPLCGGFWGDCARSFIIEGGRVTSNPTSREFQRGTGFVQELHVALQQFVTPDTPFCELFRFANTRIAEAGFENLDFLQNVGHSIPSSLSERAFIDGGTTRALGSVTCFTFEPHVRQRGGKWGFKHEDIYYFDKTGRATIL